MNRSSAALEVEDIYFEGWEKFKAEFDMEVLSSSFEFTLYDKERSLTKSLRTGLSARVSILDPFFGARQELIDGYLVRVPRSLGPTENKKVLYGNDKFIDVVECSVVRRGQTWWKKRFASIIADILEPFELAVDKRQLRANPRIDKFTIQSGESAFSAIERLCRSQAVLPLSTAKNNLLLGYAADSTVRAANDLVMGQNILSIKDDTDWSERYSEYIGLGQQAGNGRRWTKEMLQGRAVAKDAGVTRYRPKLFIAESRADNKILRKRVNWEAQVRSGRATVYTVDVSGWYQKSRDGRPLRPWVRNERTNLRVAEWELDVERLITKVSYSLSKKGELTTLTLKHPDIFKADPRDEVNLT
jgi:prophage tail gpP-like protein